MYSIFHVRALMMLAIIVSLGAIPQSSRADVTFEPSILGYKINIFGTITKADAARISARETDFDHGGWPPQVLLNSTGGDLDAAMEIGRIIRRNNARAFVEPGAKCFSSCSLIYIAGVFRGVSLSGVVGLHRPYFASSPQSRQTIEREAPLMLQSVQIYVHEMGVQDAFYQVMANTEPSNMKLYGLKLYGHREIESLVPNLDPTYDEIETAYDAREHGISTMEIRQRKIDVESHCTPLALDFENCDWPIEWGLSERVFKERWALTRSKCFPSGEDKEREQKILDVVKTKELRDHPIRLKREACVRDTMLGR
jgi:hypothetical protein